MARQIIHLPLVYSCSGAPAPPNLPIRWRCAWIETAKRRCPHRRLGRRLPNFVQQATSGRPILALDGCPLACVLHSLKRHNVDPDRYVQLQKHGVKKRYGRDAADEDVERLLSEDSGTGPGNSRIAISRKASLGLRKAPNKPGPHIPPRDLRLPNAGQSEPDRSPSLAVASSEKQKT